MIAGLTLIGGVVRPVVQSIVKDMQPNTPKISLLGECRIFGMPVSIPAHDALHLLVINPRRFKAISWGIYDVPNDTDAPIKWPSKDKLDAAAKTHNPPFIYQCVVTNYSKEDLTNVGLPMRFWFGNQGGEKNAKTFDVILSPLNAGKSSTFYAINDCSIMASGVMPDIAEVKIAGNTEWQKVPVTREYKNPIEQIMMFFPSSVRWVGGEPCG